MFDVVNPTYKDILQQIEESSIARFFLSMEYGKRYKSLFRDEDTPSAGLYYSSGGRLRYNDFVLNMSIPDAVMKLKNWDYNQFLENISKQFGIVPGAISPSNKSDRKLDSKRHKGSDKTIIKIRKREFSKLDLEFWAQFGITESTLKLFNVYSISHFWIIKDGITRLINGAKYCYCYDFYWEDNVFRRKIYQPFKGKESKWFSNKGKICQGEINMSKSGDLLIISKSLKDVMTLYELGYTAVAPPSESTFLPEEYFLKQKNRFKKIIIWYDNDFDKNSNTGIQKAEQFSQKYGIDYIYIPSEFEAKDISDFVKKYGMDKAKELTINLLRKEINEDK